MPFRNNRDAHIARIDALEHELAGARRRIEELLARAPVATEHGDAGASAPRAPRTTTWRACGRLTREYVFDRALPVEPCRRLVRTLAGRIGQRGRIELGARRAAWSGSGRRFELALRDRVTVLTCTDAQARDARLGCAIAMVALIALCAAQPGAPAIAGAVLVALVACVSAISGEPARDQASHELFEHVAELVGGEVRARGLPAGPAVTADDQRAR